MAQRKNLLKFSALEPSRTAIKQQYLSWRLTAGIPERCDSEDCLFHATALIWNQRKLRLVMDHTNGCRFDNRMENLRLLCPNCNSQLETSGGRNMRRVRKVVDQGYQLETPNGELNTYAFPVGQRMATAIGPTCVVPG